MWLKLDIDLKCTFARLPTEERKTNGPKGPKNHLSIR